LNNAFSEFEEAKRIVEFTEGNATLRLFGGLATRFHCHGPHSEHLRLYHDIDFMGLKKEIKQIFSIFSQLGYYPNERFNALYGGDRLQFINEDKKVIVDVFLDKFKMHHTLDFRKRLHLDKYTIPISDLLLTKLQIVKLSEKDVKDIIAILEDHEIGNRDNQEILNVEYISELSSKNWGLHKTISNNLKNVLNFIETGKFSTIDKKNLIIKIERVQYSIKTVKKSVTWKIRNMIGERLKWYKDVEMGEGEIY